jgi:FkbM family methyltransferase
MKKKLVFIAPHLSTGGMPQYLVKQIELIKDDCEVYCVEWGDVTGGVLVVQRNKMINLLGDRLYTLGENKHELFTILDKLQPDIIHLQEIPELFMERDVADKLYDINRKYILIETSHDSGYDPNQNKTYLPDKFLMVSQYQANLYKDIDVPCDVVEYPIENKVRTKTREQALRDLGLDPNLKHVINVGLFTPRKNQAEVIEYARMLQNYPIQFHFLGNHADNFRFYWEPLMQNFPPNCKWWNERSDVDSFYEAADLFLFTSRGSTTDHETMPLVIREALSWKVPSLIYNLPVYMGYFDKYDTIEYLKEDAQQNAYRIAEKLLREPPPRKQGRVFYTMNGEENLSELSYFNSTMENLTAYGDAAAQYYANFYLKELEKNAVTIDTGDVFVDLGANIGMSAIYASSKGVKEIYCFEPDPNMVELIKKNVPTAKLYQYAIGDSPTELELYHWPFNPVNEGPKYKCKAITLKEVLRLVGKKIDYLKVDIEGFETTAFNDLTIEDCANIDRMMVEYHKDTGVNEFCDLLRSKGFSIEHLDVGFQAFIYAKYKGTTMKKDYKFNSRWQWNDQTIHYSVENRVDFPVIVTLREYKSDAVLWSSEYDSLEVGVWYWMSPVAKHVHSYEDDPNCMGIKFCVYRKDTEEQIYEMPFVQKFVNLPSVTLSNTIPYGVNYTEFYVNHKYDRWLTKPHGLVVDIGANVGIFTKYMMDNGFARNSVMVECDKKALKDLNKHFRNNPMVTLIPKALHYSNEPITFYHSPENPVISSTLSPEELKHHLAGVKGTVQTKIDTITLRDLTNMYGVVDLLKIDIEGAEYGVIENAEDDVFTNIKTLMIECHFFQDDAPEKYTKLTNKLKRLGYTIEEFMENQVNTPFGLSENIYAYRK